MNIKAQMLAAAETRQLMKAHASYIYAWADQSPSHALVAEETQEALMDVAARLFELIEGLPVAPKKPKLDA